MNRSLWAFAVIPFLFPVDSQSSTKPGRCVVLPPVAATSLDFTEFEKWATHLNTDSPDALFPHLKEHRKHFVLIRSSNSEEKELISGRYPGAILFDPQSDLVLGMLECSPTQRATVPECHRVRAFGLDPTTGLWKAKSFGYGVPFARTRNIIDARHTTGASCVTCHGSGDTLTPRIDSYNFWIGLFGATSRLGIDVILKGTPAAREYKLLVDRVRLDRIKEAPTDLPRLSRLYWATEEEAWARANRISHFGLQLDSLEHSSEADPASALTQHLFHLNQYRLANEFGNHPKYQKYKYLLWAIGTGSCSKEILDFIPETRRSNFGETIQARIAGMNEIRRNDYAKAVAKEFPDIDRIELKKSIRGFAPIAPYPLTWEYPDEASRLPLLFVVAEEMGIDLKRRSLSRFQPLNFLTPRNSPAPLARFKEWARICDPPLSNLGQTEMLNRTSQQRESTCKALAQASRDALSKDP